LARLLFEERHGKVFACLLAQFGAEAGDVGLDFIKLADAPERLLGNW
jgi:hypothetical protein